MGRWIAAYLVTVGTAFAIAFLMVILTGRLGDQPFSYFLFLIVRPFVSRLIAMPIGSRLVPGDPVSGSKRLAWMVVVTDVVPALLVLAGNGVPDWNALMLALGGTYLGYLVVLRRHRYAKLTLPGSA